MRKIRKIKKLPILILFFVVLGVSIIVLPSIMLKSDEKKDPATESLEKILEEGKNYIEFHSGKIKLKKLYRSFQTSGYNLIREECHLSVSNSDKGMKENIKKLNQYIVVFNDNFNLNQIKDFNGNLDLRLSSEANHFLRDGGYSYYLLDNLCVFFALLDSCQNRDVYDDSSVGFSAMLKTFLANQYINKNNYVGNNAISCQEVLFVFFDKIINSRYSELEMRKMLNDLKQVIPLIPNDADNKYVIVKSRLALIQAYLEEKLGEKITAVDPYDSKPIRCITDEKGKKTFYCIGLDGIDSNGTVGDITDCDTKLKKEFCDFSSKEIFID